MRRDRPNLTSLAWVVSLLVMLAIIGATSAGCSRTPETTTTTTEAIREKVLGPGEDWAITETETLDVLTIGEGATITPPPGKTVTLTVDGVEQGQMLASTGGYDLVFLPATYVGEVVLTLSEANLVSQTPKGVAGAASGPVVQPFRQALCVDSVGFSEFKSVLAAIVGTMPAMTEAEGLTITSTGECFNGLFAASSYTLKNAGIDLTGNGRSDLSGYGAGVVGTGQGTTLVLDGVNIATNGVVRAALVASDGANVVVKNSSELQSIDGEIPGDYVPTMDPEQMRSAPWTLGLSGNVRATNLLGTGTKAAYIGSSISSQGWGALAMEDCMSPTLTVINSQISITGESGYGSYGMGSATEYFLGCDFSVPTYASISSGANLYYGDSTPERVAELNSSLRLGLTQEELTDLPNQGTLVNSLRYGIMWHGDGTSGDAGTAEITGATEFTTGETVFLDKGQAVKILVDGTNGAKLAPGNGVIMQLMDDDNPGWDPETLDISNVSYTDPTVPAERDEDHDLTRVAEGKDALATFKNIELTGDFFNSTRGGLGLVAVAPAAVSDTTSTTVAGGATTVASTTTLQPTTTVNTSASGAGTTATDGVPTSTTTTLRPGTELASVSKNLCLTFDNAKITGMITASTAAHSKPTIGPADYRLLGEVVNTPAAAVNNGVVVTITNGSVWTITGNCYLTGLIVGDNASIFAPEGKTVSMKVNGKNVNMTRGTFTGNIELIVQDKTE